MTSTVQQDLIGKVAVVIGGSGDIGSAISENLAARGATLVIGYLRDEAAAHALLGRLEEQHIKAEAIPADVTVTADVTRLFDEVVGRHGRVDIVVHTPGAVMKAPLGAVADDDFDRLVADNLRSVFLTLRASGQHLADGGRYVALSTSLTVVVPGPYTVYAAAKAGVEVLIRGAALELAARGITVNAVSPGPIDNDFFHAAETPESAHGAAMMSPCGRLGTAGDIAPVVGFLVGASADWVTGQAIRANGGMV
jgi:3-oxoacyl-[acyl-carrier protein] reductase